MALDDWINSIPASGGTATASPAPKLDDWINSIPAAQSTPDQQAKTTLATGTFAGDQTITPDAGAVPTSGAASASDRARAEQVYQQLDATGFGGQPLFKGSGDEARKQLYADALDKAGVQGGYLFATRGSSLGRYDHEDAANRYYELLDRIHHPEAYPDAGATAQQAGMQQFPTAQDLEAGANPLTVESRHQAAQRASDARNPDTAQLESDLASGRYIQRSAGMQGVGETLAAAGQTLYGGAQQAVGGLLASAAPLAGPMTFGAASNAGDAAGDVGRAAIEQGQERQAANPLDATEQKMLMGAKVAGGLVAGAAAGTAAPLLFAGQAAVDMNTRAQAALTPLVQSGRMTPEQAMVISGMEASWGAFAGYATAQLPGFGQVNPTYLQGLFGAIAMGAGQPTIENLVAKVYHGDPKTAADILMEAGVGALIAGVAHAGLHYLGGQTAPGDPNAAGGATGDGPLIQKVVDTWRQMQSGKMSLEEARASFTPEEWARGQQIYANLAQRAAGNEPQQPQSSQPPPKPPPPGETARAAPAPEEPAPAQPQPGGIVGPQRGPTAAEETMGGQTPLGPLTGLTQPFSEVPDATPPRRIQPPVVPAEPAPAPPAAGGGLPAAAAPADARPPADGGGRPAAANAPAGPAHLAQAQGEGVPQEAPAGDVGREVAPIDLMPGDVATLRTHNGGEITGEVDGVYKQGPGDAAPLLVRLKNENGGHADVFVARITSATVQPPDPTPAQPAPASVDSEEGMLAALRGSGGMEFQFPPPMQRRVNQLLRNLQDRGLVQYRSDTGDRPDQNKGWGLTPLGQQAAAGQSPAPASGGPELLPFSPTNQFERDALAAIQSGDERAMANLPRTVAGRRVWQQATGIKLPLQTRDARDVIDNWAKQRRDAMAAAPTPQPGASDALQEPSAGAVLQRQPQEAGGSGGERGGMESGQQGQVPAPAQPRPAPAASGSGGAGEEVTNHEAPPSEVQPHEAPATGEAGAASDAALGPTDNPAEWNRKWSERAVAAYGDAIHAADAEFRARVEPVEHNGPADTQLFALPGKAKELQALAQKMGKLLPKANPPAKGRRRDFTFSEPGKISTPAPRAMPKPAKGDADVVKAVGGAMSKEGAGRYAYNGVLFEKNSVVATDGKRMFIVTGPRGKKFGPKGDGIFQIDKNGVPTEPIEKEFPPWEDVAPKGAEEVSTIEIGPTIRQLRQIEAMAPTESGVQSVSWVVNKDKSLGFATMNPDYGVAEVNYRDGAREMGAINPRFLREALEFHYKASGGDNYAKVFWSAKNRPVLIEQRGHDRTVQSVTMPVNYEKSAADIHRELKATLETPERKWEALKRALNRSNRPLWIEQTHDKEGNPVAIVHPGGSGPALGKVAIDGQHGTLFFTSAIPAKSKEYTSQLHDLQTAREAVEEVNGYLTGKTPTPPAATGEVHGMATAGGSRAANRSFRNVPSPTAPEPEPAPAPTPQHLKSELLGPGSIGRAAAATAMAPVKTLAEFVDQVRKGIAPQTRGEDARRVANLLREMLARRAIRGDRDAQAFARASRLFDTLSKAAAIDFWDKAERGEDTGDPALNQIAKSLIDTEKALGREVQRVKPGALRRLIVDKNYLGRIWKNPDDAQKVMASILGKRPLEGSKGFKKHRTLDWYVDGINAGLEPISYNPVDVALLKMREMQRFIELHRTLDVMKGLGLRKFVSVNDDPPDGWQTVDDAAFKVYGPPTVTATESYDKGVREPLLDLAEKLGVTHLRKLSLGGGKRGLSYTGQNRIETTFGSMDQVIAHELGHQIGHRWNLLDRMTKYPEPGIKTAKGQRDLRVKLSSQLRALADLRYEHSPEADPEYRKYVRKGAEKEAVIVQAWVQSRDKFRDVAPDLYKRWVRFLNQTPDLKPLLDIEPSVDMGDDSYEIPHGGMLLMGNHYVPAEAAQLFRNVLTPGLRQKSGIARALFSANNWANQLRLNVSAFHATGSIINAGVSDLSLALTHLAAGHPLRAVLPLLRSASVAGSPLNYLFTGHQMLREWYKPGTAGGDYARLVREAVRGGGRAGLDETFQTRGVHALLKSMREVMGQTTIAGKAGQSILAAMHLPGAAVDAAAAPIMRFLVPRLKMGAFAHLARRNLADLGPDADPEAVGAAMTRAWDSIDNRFGQLVHDNLFWNPILRDLAMLSTTSVGWNVGDVREFGGGLADLGRSAKAAATGNVPPLTDRSAFLFSTLMYVGAMGALLTYLMTGRKPKEWKDYYYPPTGQNDEEGKPVRLSMPTYMKDLIGVSTDALRTVQNKAGPLLSTLGDLLRNKDYHGTRITGEGGQGLWKYLGGQVEPFSVRTFERMGQQGATAGRKALAFAGFTQAPQSIEDTPAEKLARQIVGSHHEEEGRTVAQTEKSRLERDLERSIRADRGKGMDALREAFREHKLTRSDFEHVLAASRGDWLENAVRGLPVAEAMKVWQVASEKEREGLRIEMIKKVLQARSIGSDQRRAMLQQVRKSATPVD